MNTAERLEHLFERLAAAQRVLAESDEARARARKDRDAAIVELAGMDMTHADIARRAGVTRVRVSNIVNGR